MKKRRLSFTLAGSLLATLAISGVAAADDNGVNELCGSDADNINWGGAPGSDIVNFPGTIVGNPTLEPTTFYCFYIKSFDNGRPQQTIVSHSFEF